MAVTDFEVVVSFNAAANAADLDGGTLLLDNSQQSELDRAKRLLASAPEVLTALEVLAMSNLPEADRAAELLAHIRYGAEA